MARHALLVATNEHEDRYFTDLRAPEADVNALKSVLEDPAIGAFDSTTISLNDPTHTVRVKIGQFFADRSREDLLLLYFSGHGVVDDSGHLYLINKDSVRRLIRATGLPSYFIRNEMEACRSKRQVLILDCCHSGAFEGAKAAIGTPINTGAAFEGKGYGRIVLTATDATQFAFEGNTIREEWTNSLFTHFIVEGLKTGEADLDGDGAITVDDIFKFASEKMARSTSKQTPGKWTYKEQGTFLFANATHARPRLDLVPGEILANLKSDVLWRRHSGVSALIELSKEAPPGLVLAIHELLTGLLSNANQDTVKLATEALAKVPSVDVARDALARLAGEQAEREVRAEAERVRAEAAQHARAEAERTAAELSERAARAKAERLAAEQAEQEARAEAVRVAAEKAEQGRAESKRVAEELSARAARAKAERVATEKAEQDARAEAERAAAEQAEQKAGAKAERGATEKAEQDARAQRAAAAAAEKAEQERRADAERVVAETADQQRRTEAARRVHHTSAREAPVAAAVDDRLGERARAVETSTQPHLDSSQSETYPSISDPITHRSTKIKSPDDEHERPALEGSIKNTDGSPTSHRYLAPEEVTKVLAELLEGSVPVRERTFEPELSTSIHGPAPSGFRKASRRYFAIALAASTVAMVIIGVSSSETRDVPLLDASSELDAGDDSYDSMALYDAYNESGVEPSTTADQFVIPATPSAVVATPKRNETNPVHERSDNEILSDCRKGKYFDAQREAFLKTLESSGRSDLLQKAGEFRAIGISNCAAWLDAGKVSH